MSVTSIALTPKAASRAPLTAWLAALFACAAPDVDAPTRSPEDTADLRDVRASLSGDENAYARYNYGAFLEVSGRPEEALYEYDRAILSDPFYVSARYQRALLLKRKGERDSAKKELEMITRLHPFWQPGWVQLGLLAAESGDREAAKKALSRARESGPPTPELNSLEAMLRGP